MDSSDDEAIGGGGSAPAETKKKPAAAAKGRATGKGKAGPKAESKAKESSLLKQKSPAEFFAENKNIAGFDNPGKSLYTTMRELVENALDSAESISELPDIEITIEEITKSKFNTMIGLVDRERVDEALYDDFESDKAREKRLAKEARFQETQAKNAALGKKVKEAPTVRAKGRGEAAFFRVTCKDNGRGMPHDDIPNMLGRVLSGTKYGLRQTRGKFGLGAKMALIWSKMSTGLPIDIKSAMKGQNYISFCRLDIDIHKNVPHVHLHEKKANKDHWHGAEIQVVIEGNWTTHRSKILHYMRQMAVITPYAQFLFRFLSDAADKNLTVSWNSYKINQQQDKIGVFVSIVSTKIPFKGTGKEYIGDDITEIASAVKSALKQCCLQLKSKIMKKLQARERQDRKRNLNRYIPDVARAIMETLVEIADESPPKRPRYDKEDEELLDKVNSQEVTETTFRDCLAQHVEQVDYEMALEYAMQSGVSEEPREDIYLNSLDASYKFVDFQSPLFVFKFIP
ncbi:hypothetical protein PR202_ga16837 [Eleusine coracana subsp. coracana]|uniref:DNA topoisomerase VI subunit B transducer domain-containing protein n=1 Tax=Eleusine coracana subsp. coracana TaxID=191504 RepID=A0AAV5CNG1_ELECO|nr:hypothetical protein PR202_ga16837 [Eleusine coracana subsp. coracana]